MHNTPEWVDENLSRELPVLRARGESQDLEYKGEFPKNAEDLGNESAAFATSNSGTILIGIDDEGALIGIEDALEASVRESLRQRIEGICRGTVKPAITPSLRYAIEDDRVIIVLSVPRGSQPIYYSGNVPYIRHITAARPAEPHEVVEKIAAHISRQVHAPEIQSSESAYGFELGGILAEVIAFGEEVDDRMFNPWLEQWRAQFSYAAADMRRILIDESGIHPDHARAIERLATSLDEVANLTLHLGSGPEIQRLLRVALDQVQVVVQDIVLPSGAFSRPLDQVVADVSRADRQLQQVLERSGELIQRSGLSEFQSEISDIGRAIVLSSVEATDTLGVDLCDKIKVVGHELHLVETLQVYMDGGRSLRGILEKVNTLHEDVKQLLLDLGGNR